MKIGELQSWHNESKHQANKSNPDEFSRLLNNERELTGQHYSAERYWQLQQSSLHFDARTIEHKELQPIENNNKEPLLLDSIPVQEHKIESLIPINNAPSSNTRPINTYENPLIRIMGELEEVIEQTVVNDVPGTSKALPESDLKSQKITDLTENYTYNEYKNNHLFIQGEQAELTLNLNELNPQEQKDLIQLIREHLKNKGLVLSRLIINGVEND